MPGLSRDQRRAVGKHIRDSAEADTGHEDYGMFYGGLCQHARHLDKGLSSWFHDAVQYAMRGGLTSPSVGYIPPAIYRQALKLRQIMMDSVWGTPAREVANQRYRRRCEAVRRIWLRHWEETGEALNLTTFTALLANREGAAFARKLKAV